jgi:curved DNA-binding protein
MKNYFDILGVGEGATDDEIKKAYRSLAMKHHPDRGGDQAKFQEIQEAYAVLSDPQKKAEWDQMRRGGFQHFHQQHHPGGFPGGFHFNFGGGGINIDEIFRNFNNDPFGQGFRNAPPPRRNKDLRVTVELDLSETLEKQTKHISVKHLNGSRQTVTVEIPRGVNNQMQMKYANYGDSSYGDLPPGDLYIEFRVRPSPDFIVEGIDLIRLIKLNCIDAITGTTLNIKGLDGTEFSWNVPVGTQHATKFRIPFQGLWAVDQPIRGNLIIVADLFVPNNLTTGQLLQLESISKELKNKETV